MGGDSAPYRDAVRRHRLHKRSHQRIEIKCLVQFFVTQPGKWSELVALHVESMLENRAVIKFPDSSEEGVQSNVIKQPTASDWLQSISHF